MPDKITLDIDADDAPEYFELVQKKHASVENDIRRYQDELSVLLNKSAQLSSMLEKLGGIYSKTIVEDETVVGRHAKAKLKPPVNGYNMKWSIWDKVQYVLRKQIEPITKNMILDEIYAIDPIAAALVGKKKRAFSVAVSACLSVKYTAKKLKRIESETDVNKYYLDMEQE